MTAPSGNAAPVRRCGKPFWTLEPNDVDIFLLMENSFDVRTLSPDARLVFDHAAAQNLLGASVFWIRCAAALGGEQLMVEHWQIKRDGNKRGILEIVTHA